MTCPRGAVPLADRLGARQASGSSSTVPVRAPRPSGVCAPSLANHCKARILSGCSRTSMRNAPAPRTSHSTTMGSLPEVPTFPMLRANSPLQAGAGAPRSPSPQRSAVRACSPLLPTPFRARALGFSESWGGGYVPNCLSSQPLPVHHPRKPPSSQPSSFSLSSQPGSVPSIYHQKPLFHPTKHP
jgi:hypothetical protein